MDEAKKILWYMRRVKALERLLSVYRTVGTYPSEALHHELKRTSKYVDHNGNWVGGE